MEQIQKLLRNGIKAWRCSKIRATAINRWIFLYSLFWLSCLFQVFVSFIFVMRRFGLSVRLAFQFVETNLTLVPENITSLLSYKMIMSFSCCCFEKKRQKYVKTQERWINSNCEQNWDILSHQIWRNSQSTHVSFCMIFLLFRGMKLNFDVCGSIACVLLCISHRYIGTKSNHFYNGDRPNLYQE